MKNRFISLFVMLVVTTAIIIGQTESDGRKKHNFVPDTTNGPVKSNFYFQKSQKKAHSTLQLNCKTCHNGEYPTKEDPDLVFCPRENIITVHHTADECPEVITLDNMSERFGAVVFSHKIHGQMSQMSDGCQGCHHYNTTGPVLACRKCHEQNRQRENIRKIDLKGAYHRQCMNCHRQWSHSTDCYYCHLPKSDDFSNVLKNKIESIEGKNHPSTLEPDKLVFNTGYEKGKMVTFYHKDHIKLFNASCNNCHREENCIKCHDVNNKLTHNAEEINKSQDVHKTLEDHHKPCSACHDQKNCSFCHSNQEAAPWNHDKSTRFALSNYHEKLSCEKCHARRNQFEKLDIDCNSCHSGWKLGSFNHKVTGLVLSDSHKDNDCETCHEGRKFAAKPTCINCHDDRSFPKNMPGKMITYKGMKNMSRMLGN